MIYCIFLILFIAGAIFLIWHSRNQFAPVQYVEPVKDERLKNELIAEYKDACKLHKELLLKHSLCARKNPAQARALLARIIQERDWIDSMRAAISNEYPDIKFK